MKTEKGKDKGKDKDKDKDKAKAKQKVIVTEGGIAKSTLQKIIRTLKKENKYIYIDKNNDAEIVRTVHPNEPDQYYYIPPLSDPAQKLLGEGGFGKVYLAFPIDAATGIIHQENPYAVKIISSGTIPVPESNSNPQPAANSLDSSNSSDILTYKNKSSALKFNLNTSGDNFIFDDAEADLKTNANLEANNFKDRKTKK